MSDKRVPRPSSPQDATKQERPPRELMRKNLLTENDPLVGKILHNADSSKHYRVLEREGKGGMGYVYLAESVEDGERCALKVLHPKFQDDKMRTQMVRRFLQEAQATLVVNHKNTVRIQDIGIHEGDPFVVMEFLEGQDLSKYLKKGKRVEWPIAKQILLQICGGLQAAHDEGIIHRDLKPGNIFILKEDGETRVKILDFGLAKFTREAEEKIRRVVEGQLTQVGFFVGTTIYASPEQARGQRNYDKRSDIYSLGIIMYQLLCGSVPFDTGDDGENLKNHLFQVPASPTERNPKANISPEVEAIAMKALEKEPGDRWQDMKEFRKAIENDGKVQTVDHLLDSDFRTQGRNPVPRAPPPQPLDFADSEVSDLDSSSDSIAFPIEHTERAEPARSGTFRKFVKVALLTGVLGTGGYYVHQHWEPIKETVSGWVRQVSNSNRRPSGNSMQNTGKRTSYQVKIETLPAGAKVYLKERLGKRTFLRPIGDTRQIFTRTMPAGEHDILLRKRGYQDVRLKVTPENSQHVISLRRGR
ncbi:protein kinase [Candidatus Micrarchaeota archaeon]|nr:protein kinase [Candidatus Micrarchaeota archaeon]